MDPSVACVCTCACSCGMVHTCLCDLPSILVPTLSLSSAAVPLTCARTGSNMSRSGGAGIPAYLSLQERLEVNQLENEEKTKQLAFLASKYKELERRVRITEGENRV